jgi:protein-tyrosine phosphatase
LIDLHSHILPGVDDGARDLDESLGMAVAAVEDGITTIAATPHVRGDFPTTADVMVERVADLREAFAMNGISLQLLPGGELGLEAAAELPDDELRRFGLGGNPEILLIETPYASWPRAFTAAVERLLAFRFTPVIGHPERNPDVQADPRKLAKLVGQGALVQITAASLDGRLGRTARSTARRLIELELVHLVASDGHGPEIRQVGLSTAYAALDDEELGYWLTQSVPAAILAGRRLPPRPPVRRPRRRLRLRQ